MRDIWEEYIQFQVSNSTIRITSSFKKKAVSVNVNLKNLPCSFLEKDAKALGATKERSPHCLVPLKFLELQQLFGEHSFLIRKPALEVISFLNQVKELETKQQVNNIRFILWGQHGNGKSAR